MFYISDIPSPGANENINKIAIAVPWFQYKLYVGEGGSIGREGGCALSPLQGRH